MATLAHAQVGRTSDPDFFLRQKVLLPICDRRPRVKIYDVASVSIEGFRRFLRYRCTKNQPTRCDKNLSLVA